MCVFHLPSLICVLMFVSSIYSRGPHHPRGAKIVKRHVHTKPSKDIKITEDVALLHDREHIQDHLGEVISDPDISKMTDDELEFHFFQVHDLDRNLKLDGLEILQAIVHTNEHDIDDEEDETEEETTESSLISLDSYIDLIDKVLMEDDLNNDGYLSYEEYKISRQGSKITKMNRLQK